MIASLTLKEELVFGEEELQLIWELYLKRDREKMPVESREEAEEILNSSFGPITSEEERQYPQATS